MQFFRKTIYDAITEHAALTGSKTPFDFKFVPGSEVKKEKDPALSKGGSKKRPLENVFLAVFIIFVLFSGLLLGGVVVLAISLSRRIGGQGILLHESGL